MIGYAQWVISGFTNRDDGIIEFTVVDSATAKQGHTQSFSEVSEQVRRQIEGDSALVLGTHVAELVELAKMIESSVASVMQDR